MKVLFAGTPRFAVPALENIMKYFPVAAVLTQKDKPQGRRAVITPSPVKQKALELAIPVLQPERVKEDVAALKTVGADVMVTCAYGQILTKEILDCFPLGVWNIHASLLPLYRGASPISAAIMDGQKETGVSIMKTDVGLDTGDILLQQQTKIEDTDTAGTLSEKLSLMGAELIVKALSMIASGGYALTKQGGGTVCKKTRREAVDFSKSADEVSAFIRALSPSPLCYGKINGMELNFYAAQVVSCKEDGPFGAVLGEKAKEGLIVKCGEGAVRVLEVQPSGGKRMRDTDFLNGGKVKKGARFESLL